MKKGINELFNLYREGNLDWDGQEDLFGQMRIMALRVYWKYDSSLDYNPIQNDDLESIINVTITKSIQMYDPSNSNNTKFTTYYTNAFMNNIKDYVKYLMQEKRFNPNLLDLDSEIEGKENGLTFKDVVGQEEDYSNVEVFDTLWKKLYEITLKSGKGALTEKKIERNKAIFERRKRVVLMRMEGYPTQQIADSFGKGLSKMTVDRDLRLVREILSEVYNF